MFILPGKQRKGLQNNPEHRYQTPAVYTAVLLLLPGSTLPESPENGGLGTGRAVEQVTWLQCKVVFLKLHPEESQPRAPEHTVSIDSFSLLNFVGLRGVLCSWVLCRDV